MTADAILAALAADAAVCWEVLTRAPKIAGPWHRRDSSEWVRPWHAHQQVGSTTGVSTLMEAEHEDDLLRRDGFLLVGGPPSDGLLLACARSCVSRRRRYSDNVLMDEPFTCVRPSGHRDKCWGYGADGGYLCAFPDATARSS